MKSRYQIPALLIALFIAGAKAIQAAEQLQLQPRLFVFKNSEIRSLTIEPPPAAGTTPNATAILSPAFLRFDDATLTLADANFSWSSGVNPPPLMNPVPVQPLRLQLGQAATIRCAAPTQYFAPQPDGSFRVREIAADSPDVPRYLLSLVAESPSAHSPILNVTCRAEVASVLAREKIPGVDLEVGRPKLGLHQEELHITTRRGEWTALLLRAPKRNDYSVLVLFRIVSADSGPDQPATEATQPPATKSSVPATKAGPTVLVAGSCVLTDTGAALPQPTMANPIRYVAFDTGFFEHSLSAKSHETRVPRAADIRAALQFAMLAHGFAPATSAAPPTVAIIYHWGSLEVAPLLITDTPRIFTNTSLAFVIVSAYDYAELTHGRKTLLWRAGLHTLDRPKNAPVDASLLALMRSIGPLLGRDLATRNDSTIKLTEPPDIETQAAPNPVDYASDQPTAAIISALVAHERERLHAKHDLPIREDLTPHQTLLPAKP